MVHWYTSLIKQQQLFQTLKKTPTIYKLKTTITENIISFLFNASLPHPSYPGMACISHTESSSPPNKPAPSFISLPFLWHQAPFLEGFCGPESSLITPALWSHSTLFTLPLGLLQDIPSLQYLDMSPSSFVKDQCQTVMDSSSIHLPCFPVRSHKQSISMPPALQHLHPLPAKKGVNTGNLCESAFVCIMGIVLKACPWWIGL